MTNPPHLDPDTMTKVAFWRAKSLSGDMTLDEYKQAILEIRAARTNAASTKPKSTAKAKAPARSTDDLLNELDSI
jgi:hypothetical protein